MTREELKHITDLCFNVPMTIRLADESRTYRCDECATAKQIVMDMLEQEPCEDAISRQAVLDKAVYTETEEGWSGRTVDVKDIEALPSVTPAEPKAEWVSVSERLPDKNGNYLVTQIAFGCKGVRIVYYGTRLSKDHPCWYDYDSEYGYHEVYDIIAWMPLPAPWEESEGKA